MRGLQLLQPAGAAAAAAAAAVAAAACPSTTTHRLLHIALGPPLVDTRDGCVSVATLDALKAEQLAAAGRGGELAAAVSPAPPLLPPAVYEGESHSAAQIATIGPVLWLNIASDDCPAR